MGNFLQTSHKVYQVAQRQNDVIDSDNYDNDDEEFTEIEMT